MAAKSSAKAKIGVLGASGYTGSELVRLLLRHPNVELALLTADRRAGQEMRAVFPQFSPFKLPTLVSIESIDWKKAALDLAFCALPHATTQKVIERSSGQGAEDQGGRSLAPTSGCTTRPPMRNGTATSITRRSCSARRSMAWSRCIAQRSRRRGLSPTPAATRAARSLR